MDNDNSCLKINKKLNDYIDNNISSSKSIKIKHHIGECQICKLKYANLLKVKEMIRTVFTSNKHTNSQIDLSTEIMYKIEQSVENKENNARLKPNFSNYKFLAFAVATILMLAVTIIYTQSENRKLMAAQTKIDSYAIEHSSSGEIIELMQLTNRSVKTINYNK